MLYLLLVCLALVSVSASDGNKKRKVEKSFGYTRIIYEACFYENGFGGDPCIPYFKKKRSENDEPPAVPRLSPSSSPEFVELMNAAGPVDEGFLERVITSIREQQQARRRRSEPGYAPGYFFGFSYSIGLEYGGLENGDYCDDNIGISNTRLEFSAMGIHTSTDYTFFGELDGDDSECDAVDLKNDLPVGSFSTKSTFPFYDGRFIPLLFIPAYLFGSDGIFIQNREPYAKDFDFYDEKVTMQTAVIYPGVYYERITLGKKASEKDFEKYFILSAGVLFGGVAMLGGVLYARKKRQEAASPTNAFETDVPEIEAQALD